MSDSGVLYIHNTEPHISVLGPGRRYVVWTQGCLRRCPGCLAPQTRPLRAGQRIPVETLARRVLASGDDGLTISGGEPFLQCDGLCELLDAVRAVRDMGVIVYTGNTLEELRARRNASIDALLSRIDVLIDGPYIEALNDDLGLRGSSNQRCLFLTERYRDQMTDFGASGARKLEHRINDDGFFIVGVPTRAGLRLIKPDRKDEGTP